LAARRNVWAAVRPLHGAGLQPEKTHRPAWTGVHRVLVEECLDDQIDRFVERGAATGELDAERGELRLEVAGADAEDHPAAGQRVECGERLRRRQRMTIRRHPHVRQQADLPGRRRQEAERRNGVVPDGRHRRGVRARHADVIGHGEVEEAVAIAGLGDATHLGVASRRLPRLDEGRALRRDRQLHAVDELAGGDD
jgi:hypothetical protein